MAFPRRQPSPRCSANNSSTKRVIAATPSCTMVAVMVLATPAATPASGDGCAVNNLVDGLGDRRGSAGAAASRAEPGRIPPRPRRPARSGWAATSAALQFTVAPSRRSRSAHWFRSQRRSCTALERRRVRETRASLGPLGEELANSGYFSRIIMPTRATATDPCRSTRRAIPVVLDGRSVRPRVRAGTLVRRQLGGVLHGFPWPAGPAGERSRGLSQVEAGARKLVQVGFDLFPRFARSSARSSPQACPRARRSWG